MHDPATMLAPSEPIADRPAHGQPRSAVPRPVVLVLVRHYLPGFRAGGPIRSVANLVMALCEEFDFRIACLDHDYGQTTPYAGVPRRRWIVSGGAAVGYFTKDDFLPWRVGRTFADLRYDVLYLNSFFDPLFSIAPIVAVNCGLLPRTPIVLAPRGEFAGSALGLKAPKKRAFLRLSKLLRLHREVTWQATSSGEHADILETFEAAATRCVLAPNLPGPCAGSPVLAPGRNRSALRAVLLGRIARMKNVAQAIDIVARMRVPTVLDIWGPIDDADYWRECQRAIARCPSHVAVRYRGSIEHRAVHAALQQYDVLLLPTLGENHGHAIGEAFAAGVPVVTSDRTPWRGLAESGVGFDIPLTDTDGFVRALERHAAMTPKERNACRERCLRFAARRAACDAELDATRRLFGLALGVARHGRASTAPCAE